MTEPKRVGIIPIVIIAILVAAVCIDARADNGHGHDHDSNDVIDSSNIVSTSLSDSSSAYAIGMGDVDPVEDNKISYNGQTTVNRRPPLPESYMR